MNLSASEILNLLAIRHSGDVFVPECKDGPSYGGGHVRLDGWAMKRSWANPLVVGYEIKVSRSDFLKDDKWPAYLPMCNQLYFVCPTGLIQPPEVPAEVGLLWASKNGTRLYTKAKAAHREVTIPETVWRYVLMCRAKITREHHTGNRREYWEEWLKQKRVDLDFGYRVGKAIRQRVEEEVVEARHENERLEKLMKHYDDIRALLKELDLDPNCQWRSSTFNVEKKIEQARRLLPDGLLRDLENVAAAAARAKDSLAKLET